MAFSPAGNISSSFTREYSIPNFGRDNKSLHPIWSLVPKFAWRSCGAANFGPMAQTGELNRYIGGIRTAP